MSEKDNQRLKQYQRTYREAKNQHNCLFVFFFNA